MRTSSSLFIATGVGAAASLGVGIAALRERRALASCERKLREKAKAELEATKTPEEAFAVAVANLAPIPSFECFGYELYADLYPKAAIALGVVTGLLGLAGTIVRVKGA